MPVEAINRRSMAIMNRRTDIGAWIHLIAIAWFVLMAGVVLAPALRHGDSFGSFDLLTQLGFLQRHGVVPHNLQAGDQADSIIPWADLSWTQVHQGHLPLWNPYEGLGMPLAFNWQSASFGVPALISYLFPYNLVITIQVFATLIIAGTGMYVLGRVIGLNTISCIFGGTVFELSGPMLGWLGWPHSAVMSWAGWLFAATFAILRGGRGVWSIACLGLVIAAMVYAGQPEVLTLFGISVLIVATVSLLLRTPLLKGSGPIRVPIVNLSLGAASGLALVLLFYYQGCRS